jgi:hypothetical protein
MFTRCGALVELRQIEERTFRETSLGDLEYLLERGWVRSGPLALAGWKALAAAMKVIAVPMKTPFAGGRLALS